MGCCSPVLQPLLIHGLSLTNLAGSLLLGKACALQGASLWPALGWDGWMDRWTDNPAVAGVPAPSVPVLPGWWIYVPVSVCCAAVPRLMC